MTVCLLLARSIEGMCNNLENPHWGAAMNAHHRYTIHQSFPPYVAASLNLYVNNSCPRLGCLAGFKPPVVHASYFLIGSIRGPSFLRAIVDDDTSFSCMLGSTYISDRKSYGFPVLTSENGIFPSPVLCLYSFLMLFLLFIWPFCIHFTLLN